MSSSTEYVRGGKGGIDERLGGYNNAARHSRWLVLRDLDHDAPCAPELCHRLLPTPAPKMRLHVAVRALEAWLMADAEAMSQAFGIPRERMPAKPETMAHPKRALVELARHSRIRAVREAMVPGDGTTALVGAGYSAMLIEFAMEHWRPGMAARRSHSLATLRSYLRELSRSR